MKHPPKDINQAAKSVIDQVIAKHDKPAKRPKTGLQPVKGKKSK
jgi:hypothetical protein